MPTGTKPAPLAGWMRCDFHYRFQGVSTSMNTFWLSYDPTQAEAATDTDLSTIEALIRNDWLTYFSPSLSSALLLSQIRLVLFRASGEIALPFTTSATGTDNGAIQGAQQAAVVNWDVHAFYRGGKPKMFLPGLHANAITNVVDLAPSWASTLETHMNSWIGGIHLYVSSALSSAPVLIAPSWATGGAYRPTAIQRQIYRAWVQPRICTQRRRLGAPVG